MKVGGGTGPVTVRMAVAVRLITPLAPATVNVELPAGALARVLKVRVAVPGELGFGEKLQLAWLGRPLHDRFT